MDGLPDEGRSRPPPKSAPPAAGRAKKKAQRIARANPRALRARWKQDLGRELERSRQAQARKARDAGIGAARTRRQAALLATRTRCEEEQKVCRTEKEAHRQEAREEIARLTGYVRDMIRADRELRRAEKRSAATAPRETAAEKRKREAWEADHEIEPHEWAAWVRTRAQFRGSPHQRVERFREYMEAEGERAYHDPDAYDAVDWAREERAHYAQGAA